MNNSISSENFKKINEAYEVQDFLIGTVSYIGKSYLIVKIYGYPCIMNKSEVEPFFVKDFSIYYKKEIVVKVVSIKYNDSLSTANVFVSHKSVAEEVLEQNKISSFEDVKKNYKYRGIVKECKNFGASITLGKLEGLVPKSHLPSEYVDTPENFVTIGAVVDVIIIYKDYDKEKLTLSIPSIDPNPLKYGERRKTPFELFKDKLIPNETVLQGKVVFIERDLVTLHVVDKGLKFTVYVKKEDLTWESVQSSSDVVFLGEELSIRYLYYENNRLFFDLKWQQKDIYPQELFSMDTDEILESMNITENDFVAKIAILNRNGSDGDEVIAGAFASNIMAMGSSDGKSLLVDNYTGSNITAFVPVKYLYSLEDGKYYRFRLEVAPKEKRQSEHRPYMFKAILVNATPLADPYHEQVDKSFKENKTPKSNRESASYLKEIGADMYADRDRMFYELLQNADDSSPLRGVKVMVQIKDNYLIFTHDGLPFSIQDFRAIVSTAYSTKRLDRKKTGYKGIGFKSVFTDSQKVYIRTGGFYFLFDKTAELFKNFREFYRFVNPLYTDEQFDVFLEENREYEQEFEGVEHLPWQLLPFWLDDYPESLLKTSYSRNCNVAIALDMGVTAEKYKETIKGIIQNPRFMLFLRNTLRIQYEDKKWDILSIAKQTDDCTHVVKLKNSFASKDNEISYIVREGSEIPVSNEAFESCNLPMVKECKDIAGREKWYMYQIIDNMRTPITSIPERIIAADTTTLSYAFMLDENGSAICIPDKTPSLYAYLPMEDRRYLFPFFINADFELSSNRQEAKRVSVWNEYIFYNIGKNIVEWVATLANPSHPLYLSLLPSLFFTEELEEGKIDRLAAQFNRGYKESLSETPFILNDKEEIVRQNDIVIDESCFADIIGSDDFCRLLSLKKRLLHKDINVAPLTNKTIFAEVEHIQTSSVVDFITSNQNRTQLLRYWCGISADLRLSVLSHIVNMPGNKKNLSDNLLDIPAYTCNNRLYSFYKLQQSDKIILNCDIIKGIEEIVNKLGFNITDEVESEHPFHEKISNVMADYDVHVFDIIAIRTAENSHPITADEKVKLFKHFVSYKTKIEHDKLSQWGIFGNQVGDVKPLSRLSHIDSSLYNNITKQFVIDETEYDLASHIIDRYLMKEKDQYQELIINNWDSLASEVGEDENKACSLYQLATTTYTVAEHEQANKTTKFSTNDKEFVFVEKQWLSLSETILNSNLAENEKAKEVVEKITKKQIPSRQVIESIAKDPFNCESQSLKDIKFLADVWLTKEQVVQILKYCLENNDTVFKKYYLAKGENGYSFMALGKDEVVGYTNDEKLLPFIQYHCQGIKALPDEFSEYKKLEGILTEEGLLLRILECIKDVKGHESILLPIFKDSLSLVKTAYINHMASMTLDEQSCIDKEDLCVQTLLMASTIEKPDNSFFDNLRNKLFITSGTMTTALSKIKLEHTVEVNGKKFPLSKLLPNEDKMAITVDTLKERIEEFVPITFVDKLFDEKIDNERASSVFAELNKTSVTLENASQIAFMLDYASSTRGVSKILCYVYDSLENPVRRLLCGQWILSPYSFINDIYILNPQYGDLAKHLTLPFVNDGLQCNIQNDLVNYDFIKPSLVGQECHDLLDSLLKKNEESQNISANDIAKIKTSLGIANKDYVISDQYSLEEEKLPEIIDSWRTAGDEEKRTGLLCELFNFINDSSDVVKVRRYLADETPFVLNLEESRLSNLTCNWLYKKSISLDDKQYLAIQDVIDEKDYSCKMDIEQLKAFQTAEYRYMSFSNYTIYLFKGQIPWHVKIKQNNYIFHQYNQDDVALCGFSIFVNEQQTNNILDLIRSLVNTGGFTTEDFMNFFDQYNASISGSLEGEMDDDLDEDARSAVNDTAKQEAINWLSLKGYDISNVETEYSFVKGVRKGDIEYHIVVKSYRSKKKELKLNPNEWLYLLKANSRLMLYMGHMAFAVIDRKMLLGNHDFLRLRISSSNFSLENGNLDEVLNRLAGEVQFFERTHFVFEHVHENILSRANSLEDYGFFKSNSDGQFTAGDEEDIS